jgi:hypothetical protein
MARVVKLNEGQLRKLVRRMLNENPAMSRELQDIENTVFFRLDDEGMLDMVISDMGYYPEFRGGKLINGGNPFPAGTMVGGENVGGFMAANFLSFTAAQDFALYLVDEPEDENVSLALPKDVLLGQAPTTPELSGVRYVGKDDAAADAAFEAEYGPGYRRKF